MGDLASGINGGSESHLTGAVGHCEGEPAIAPAVVMDGEGRLLDINDAFSKAVGVEREQAIGLCHPFPWCPVEDVSRCSKFLKRVSGGDEAVADLTTVSWRCGGSPMCLLVLEPVVLGDAPGERVETTDRTRDLEAAVRLIALELARLDEATHALPEPVSQRSCEGLDLLSSREREILTPFLAGRRVSSIAKLLFISPHTVRNHLQSIYRKVGVRSQSELIDKLNGLA